MLLLCLTLLFSSLLTSCDTGGGEVTTEEPDEPTGEVPPPVSGELTGEASGDVSGETSSEVTTGDSSATEAGGETTTDPNAPKKPKIAVLSGAGASTKIYSKMVEMTGKQNPKCLIITAAGKDGVDTLDSYGSTMRKYTSNVEFLTLCTRYYTEAELRELILGADMILEVGGQSEFMAEAWEMFGLPALLTEAYNNGVVI